MLVSFEYLLCEDRRDALLGNGREFRVQGDKVVDRIGGLIFKCLAKLIRLKPFGV